MRKLMKMIWAVIFVLAGSLWAQDVAELHNLGYVVVSPNGPTDGGDFGPKTPGTKTSGLQEAFDHAKEQNRDLYIMGNTWYRMTETLHITWRQNFRCDGGEYGIAYDLPHGDAVWIDSQMNVYMKLGSIYAVKSDGAAVHMKPQTIGPDGFAVITASRFEFDFLISGGDPLGKVGSKQIGTALFLDGDPGCITNNRIFAIETSAADKGLYIRKDVFNNLIEIDFMHLCNTHIQIGDAKFPGPGWNRIETVVMDGDSLNWQSSNTGARIFGHTNILTLNIVNASSGQGIIFEPTARNNIVHTLHLAGGITNNAVVSNNRVIPTRSAGLQIETPDFPKSGQDITNRTCFPVEVIILTDGQVSNWTITETSNKIEWVFNPLREDAQPMNETTHTALQPSNQALQPNLPKTVPNSPRTYHKRLLDQSDVEETSQTINAPLFGGQCIILDTGDKIRFNYTKAPSWKWKALR